MPVTLVLAAPGPNAGGIAPRERYRKACSGETEPGGKPTGTGTGRQPKGTNRRPLDEGNQRRTPDEGNQRTAGEGDEPGGQTGNRRKARRESRRP